MNDKEEKRTPQQNRALHLYFTLVADALNDAGLTVQETVPNFRMDLDWNSIMVKELLWKFAMKKMFNKDSTTELTKKKEIDQLHETINRFLGSLGVEYIPFPYACKTCNQIGKHAEDCANQY